MALPEYTTFSPGSQREILILTPCWNLQKAIRDLVALIFSLAVWVKAAVKSDLTWSSRPEKKSRREAKGKGAEHKHVPHIKQIFL